MPQPKRLRPSTPEEKPEYPRKQHRGKPKGAQKFTESDERRLLRTLAEVLPEGYEMWHKVAEVYNEVTRSEGRKLRDGKFLRGIYRNLLKKKSLTGDQPMPPNVHRALEIEEEIAAKGMVTLCDNISELEEDSLERDSDQNKQNEEELKDQVEVEVETTNSPTDIHESNLEPDIQSSTTPFKTPFTPAESFKSSSSLTKSSKPVQQIIESSASKLAASSHSILQNESSGSTTSGKTSQLRSKLPAKKKSSPSTVERIQTPRQTIQRQMIDRDQSMARMSAALEPDTSLEKYGIIQLVQSLLQKEQARSQRLEERLDEYIRKYDSLLADYRKLELKIHLNELLSHRSHSSSTQPPSTQSSSTQPSTRQDNFTQLSPHGIQSSFNFLLNR